MTPKGREAECPQHSPSETSGAPPPSSTVAVTKARAESVYPTTAESPDPSSFGETSVGESEKPSISGGSGAGVGAGTGDGVGGM